LIEISIHTAIPGKIVGRSKEPLNELKDLLEQVCEKRAFNNLPKAKLFVLKVQNPYASASIIADSLIEQLEQRVPFRAALKKSLERIRVAKLEGLKFKSLAV
jgi:small subunit ribosomal protein S3